MHPTIERVFGLRNSNLAKEGLRLPRVVLALSGFFLVVALGIHLWFLYFMKPLSEEVYTPGPKLIEQVNAAPEASKILAHIKASETAIRRHVDRLHVISVTSFLGLALYLLQLSLARWKLVELASQIRQDRHLTPEEAPSSDSID